jgi:hypothetical protein
MRSHSIGDGFPGVLCSTAYMGVRCVGPVFKREGISDAAHRTCYSSTRTTKTHELVSLCDSLGYWVLGTGTDKSAPGSSCD